MTTDRLLQILGILKADWPTYDEGSREWSAGYNAALESVGKAVALEDAVMAGMPAVERISTLADTDYTEAESRFAWGDR